MGTITLIIDSVKVEIEAGKSVLEAADHAGIYIPRLCHHPDLPPASKTKLSNLIYRGGKPIKNTGSDHENFEGCKLCIVEIEGIDGFPTACDTPASNNMIVHTNTAQIQEARRDNLAKILVNHPHACLLCAEREGCARDKCTLNVPVEERCCENLGRCELQKVAEYIGIPENIPRYVFKDMPVEENSLYIRNHNLCIDCGRCVRICRDVRGVDALGVVHDGSSFVVGNLGPSIKDSECKFCTACVEICPTGALIDKDIKWAERQKELVPCKYTCPANIDVPRYIRLISDGNHAEAAAVIREKVPLPNILGQVCHHPCETECRRGKINEAMSICALKRFAAEKDTGLWRNKSKVAPPTDKKVAVVGGGPAGLTAAYYLTKKGHNVTIFERLPECGGMMRVGAPEYRIPRKVLEKDINEILKLGINLKTNTSIGRDLNLKDLTGKFDAVFLAIGADQSRKLKIEGMENKGVLWGLDFLKDINLGRKVEVENRVLVVGGGNVAIDVARAALRSGAKEVQLACLESRQQMPAHEWEIQEALDEGIIFNVSCGPKKIIGNGKVTGIELVGCTSVFDETGRFNPCFDQNITKSIDTDMVIISVGQASDLSLLEGTEVQIERGTIKVDSNTLKTIDPKIFAGGDVVKGPASVIDAIAMGRKAASSIDKYLGGDGVIDESLIPTEKPDPWLGQEKGFADRSRVKMSLLPVKERLHGYSQVELGFGDEEAIEEAKRCLRCDVRLQISSVILPPEKWLSFDSQNVSKVPETDGVFQLFDEEKNIILISGAADLHKALQERLETTQKARYFIYEEHPMYTMRESELLQKYLKEHGKMPELNDELSDLF